MNSLALCLSVACFAQGDGHAGLHPDDTTFFIAIPDLQQLFEAYLGTPAMKLLDDEEVQHFAAKIAGADPEQFHLRTELLELAATRVANLPPPLVRALSLLGEARSFSFSLSVPELDELIDELYSTNTEERAFELLTQHVGVLCFLEFQSPEAAAGAAEMLANLPGTELVAEEGVPALELDGASGVPQRIAIEGAPFGYWIAAAGDTLALGLGSATPGGLAGRIEDPSRSLAQREGFRTAGATFLGPEGVTVYETWFHLDRLSDLVRVSTWGVPDSEQEVIEAAMKALVGHQAFDYRTRTRIVGDRFVGEGFEGWPSAATSMFDFLGTEPIDAETLAFLPPDAVAAWVTRMDPEILLERALEFATNATGADPGETLLRLERDYGLRPVDDLFQALGTRAAIYVLPISGLTIPKIHLALELRDPTAFQRAMEGFGRMAETLAPGEVRVETRPYRDVPLYTFAPKRDIGELAGSVGAPASVASMAPNLIDPELSVAIIGNRALFGISARSNKHEIKRLLGEDESSAAAHPLAGAEAGIPADATSASFVDWASMIGGFYSSFRTFMPMIAQYVQGLPFGPEDLPQADIFARHFEPSIAWTRPVEGGCYEYSQSSLGPEVPIAFLCGMGAAIFLPQAGIVRPDKGVVVESSEPPPPAPAGGEPSAEAARERTVVTLREIKLGLVLFKNEHDRHPEALSQLLEPSPNFPRGFLGGSEVPDDGWGRDVFYVRDEQAGTFRLWSAGPDGMDDSGADDDVVLN